MEGEPKMIVLDGSNKNKKGGGKKASPQNKIWSLLKKHMGRHVEKYKQIEGEK